MRANDGSINSKKNTGGEGEVEISSNSPVLGRVKTRGIFLIEICYYIVQYPKGSKNAGEVWKPQCAKLENRSRSAPSCRKNRAFRIIGT